MKNDSVWPVKYQVWAGILTLAIIIGGVGGWSVFTQINGAVIAMGQIEVDQNRQIVQHPIGGIVEDIRVREGDAVAAGDLLVSLDDQTLRSELSVVENQLFEAIARRGRHEAEQQDSKIISFDVTSEEANQPEIASLLTGQTNLFDARRVSSENQKQQLSRRHEQIDSQIIGIMSQKTALEKQLSLIGDELKSQQTLLDRGLAQSARVSELARSEANLEGQIGQLIASIAESEGRKTEIDLSILKVDSDRREEAISDLRDLQTKEAQLIERRIELQRELDRTQIKAPVSGIVYGLNVFAPKSVIKPADPIMFLVPQDRPLVISARIEVKDIDQIRFNQEVALRFSAFDQRTTPQLLGHITKISADAFNDQQSRASYYRAEIALNDDQEDLLPEQMVLIPGMPVEAFIKTQDRTPAQYFMKPLLDFFAKSFRES